MSRRPLICTLFPYTTLFRSDRTGTRNRDAPGLARTRGRRTRPGGERGRRAGHREVDHAHHLAVSARSEEHTSELQSPDHLVCRLLLEKKKKKRKQHERKLRQ